MKIAIIIPRLTTVGPVKVIQALVNSLYENKNLQIKVFYLDKAVDPSITMMVQVERLIPGRFRFSDYDIIHTNGIRPDLYAFLNRKKIRYHISTIHNFVFEDLSLRYNRFISFIFGNRWLKIWKRADKLVCVSNVMENYYRKWFSSSELEVIHNGIAKLDNSFIPDYDVIKASDDFRSRGIKVLGSAGILTKIKGMDQILFLLSDHKEFALILIGCGNELPYLQRLARKMNISDRCLFCGFRSNAASYFRHFDYYIMPSRSEGFGLSLIEAVQQKIPVICSDIPVFKELFSADEVTFFQLDDHTSLAKALLTAKVNGKTKSELAYARYINNYTDLLMAKRYYDLYQSA